MEYLYPHSYLKKTKKQAKFVPKKNVCAQIDRGTLHTHTKLGAGGAAATEQSASLFTQPWSTQSSPTPLISGSPPSLETVLWWLITRFDPGLFHLHDISRTVIVMNIHRICRLLQSPSTADLPWVPSFRYAFWGNRIVFFFILSIASWVECCEMHHIL